MTEQQAMVAAMIHEPDVEIHRLRYGDWLEEHGKAEWGRFVRDTERPRNLLSDEEFDAARWQSGIRFGPGDRDYRAFEWDRGLVTEWSGTLAKWLDHGPALCELHPVRVLTITDKRPDERGWSSVWLRGEVAHLDYSLPVAAYRLLPGLIDPTVGVAGWESTDKALAALHSACFRLARPWYGPQDSAD